MSHTAQLTSCCATAGCPRLGGDDTGPGRARDRGHREHAMATTTDVRILDQRTPEERDRPFLPGMGKTWLLPLYDVFTRVAGVRAVHERLAELAGIEPGQAVVDIGCGTANLSLAVLAAQPGARVTGLDPDGDALRRAARK